MAKCKQCGREDDNLILADGVFCSDSCKKDWIDETNDLIMEAIGEIKNR